MTSPTVILILILEVAVGLLVVGLLLDWWTQRRANASGAEAPDAFSDPTPTDPHLASGHAAVLAADAEPDTIRIPFAGADFEPWWTQDPERNDAPVE